MSDDITLWSAVAQARSIRERKVTSEELLERVIARVEQLNPELNALCTLELSAARRAAREADAAVASGHDLGPLHGLPISIKDALCTRDIRSTGGATELRNNVPARDAPVVAALKRAGAYVIGKSNLPRWSGDIQSYNELFGTTNNPWDLNRVPGGSSGGAACAVATGMSAFEIGTDIGGSIRFPSAYCGVYGHKPTFGVVPSRGYLDHEFGGSTEADVNVLGPIARSAGDLELLLDIIRRDDPVWTARLDEPTRAPEAMRIAAWLDDEFCSVDATVLEVMSATADTLSRSGYQVDREARPDLSPLEASTTGMALVRAAISQSTGDERISHRQWLELHRQRESLRERWRAFFANFDAVLMPVSFVPPFEHLQEGNFLTRTLECNGEPRPYGDLVRWTILTGMAYLPSTVVPVGQDRNGLPVGMQVVSDFGRDRWTIRLAAQIGELTGGYSAPPIARRASG